MQTKHIVVIGCGRLGGMIANRLSAADHSLVVIDEREAAFDKLSINFSGYKLIGNAIELHILQQAKVHLAHYLFATTTLDNTNLMIAQVAKTVFNVPIVIARVFDPERETIYREFGIETISPTKLSADAFLNRIG
jgi:trk system potassium uptake protein